MPPSMVMSGSYDLRLVALSVVIAVVSSFAALDLAGRVTASQNKARVAWLVGGSAAMGLGIWSMHYIGMLAFSMPMQMFYDPPTVFVSLFAAIIASAVALFTVSRVHMGGWQVVLGSICMGSGIAAMHYIGMAALRISAHVSYNPWLVSASIVLAVAISLVALLLTFRVRDEKKTTWRKIVSSLVMGSAIPVMHYTGMWAASFTPSVSIVDHSHAASISSIGITAIAVSSLLTLTLVIVTAFLDRLLSAQKAVAQAAGKGEQYFRTMADAIPQIIWTAPPNGKLDFYNRRWSEYTGKNPSQSGDWGWEDVVHPDDLQAYQQKWQQALRTGNAFDIEYRLRRTSDGRYRWHLGRAVPLGDSQGQIVKWFGSCTDIENQKQNQQNLEEEVRQRTQAVLESKALLTEEMSQRERTQRELDQQTQKLLRELTDRSQMNALLAKMGDLLQSCTNLKEAFAIVLSFAPKMFPQLRGAVILLNASRSLLEVVGSWADCQLSSSVFEPDSCWALRTGHRYEVLAGDHAMTCGHAASVTSPYVCIPIQAQGEALGVIHFQAADDIREISGSELSLAGTFAEQTGLSIANIRLREALRNQSIRDALTGLFNRRYLEETLEREVHRTARANQALSVTMMDVDHFKSFNDTFGHAAGDAVLHEIGVFLHRNTRADDIACRYGGEEFVLIMPNADAEATRIRIEQIRLGVKELRIMYGNKPLGPITVSAGIATFPAHGSSSQQIMSAADAALYEAKKGGRDCVVVAEGGADLFPGAITRAAEA
jgi:diguanylate cyclase (GGDEF)-like protein/PAS domain S-box-containing protein